MKKKINIDAREKWDDTVKTSTLFGINFKNHSNERIPLEKKNKQKDKNFETYNNLREIEEMIKLKGEDNQLKKLSKERIIEIKKLNNLIEKEKNYQKVITYFLSNEFIIKLFLI